MEPGPDNTDNTRLLWRLLLALVTIAVTTCILGLLYLAFGDAISFDRKPPRQMKEAQLRSAPVYAIANGLHVESGLVYAPGFEAVLTNCTNCHSGMLITQNRATRQGWDQMIRWMQETQGLWELGVKKDQILDYLAEHYAPVDVGRRAQLTEGDIQWYHLALDE